MNPRHSEPVTEAPDTVAGTDADDDEEVPPWPERGPEIVATVPPDPDPEREPIPLPGPDPAPEPAPVPHPDPDPVPEPGPVSSSVQQDEGTDEGSADLDDGDDADDVDVLDDGDDRPQLELLVHEEPEVEVAPVDDDVDVELEVDPVGRPLLTDAGVWEERWAVVQAGFVDDPGLSIHQADRLVTDAMEEVARLLLARREALQDRWRTDAGDPPPDTERLRVTVQGYRALLFGLLSV